MGERKAPFPIYIKPLLNRNRHSELIYFLRREEAYFSNKGKAPSHKLDLNQHLRWSKVINLENFLIILLWLTRFELSYIRAFVYPVKSGELFLFIRSKAFNRLGYFLSLTNNSSSFYSSRTYSGRSHCSTHLFKERRGKISHKSINQCL